MVATVSVLEVNSSPPVFSTLVGVGTTITSRFCTADTVSPGLNFPLPIPAGAGQGYGGGDFNYSYWKSWCLKFEGNFTQVSNIRLYANSTFGWTWGSEGGIFIGGKVTGDQGCPIASYAVATGVQGQSGHPLSQHSFYSVSGSTIRNLEDYISESNPLTIDSSAYTISPSTCKLAVVQVKVHYTGTRGAQPPRTITWMWDEI